MADLRTAVLPNLTKAAAANAGMDAQLQQEQLTASLSPSLSRGWTSAGLSERANQLLWDASTAYKAGDIQTAGALEAEGRKTAELASVWSPEVKNWSDVHDLSSGAKWAAGALGNVRSSIMPAIGGLLGAAGGGLLTRSAQGARWGAGLGAGLMGYDQMTNETAGQAMLDPQIRANKTIDDIRGTSRVSGAIQAPLEALVPATMGTALLGLAKGAGKQAIKTAVAKEVGREAAGEFGTEFAQDLVGQGAINTLKDRPTTELDYRQALDSAMAGAVAGGGMGLVGGAGQAAHLAAGKATDTAVDVAKDPSKLIEKGAAMAGAGIGKGLGWAEGKLNGLNVDPDERALMSGHREVEKNMSGEEFLATRRAAGDAVAGRVLAEPNKYGKEEVEAAQAYMAGGENRNVFRYRDARMKFKGAKQAEKDAADEIEELSGGKVRASKVRASLPEGLPGLSEDDKLDTSGGMNPAQESERAALNEEGRAAKEKVKSDWENTRSILADIWRKQGVDEGVLHETRGIDNDSNRQFAITMMDWVKRGFKTQDGETVVPERMISNHGVENATHLVKKASDLLVRQGVLTPEDAKARLDEMLPQIKEVGRKWKADEEAVFSSLTPTAEAKINESFDGMDESEIARERQALVREIREIGRNGHITKAQEASLEQLFGPRKNEVLDRFYVEKKQSDTVADDSVQQELDDAAKGDYDPNITTGKFELEDAKPEYVNQSKANEYFDLKDELHRGQLERMSKERSSDTHAVSHIGIVDREIEKAEEAAGAEFDQQARFGVKAGLVEKHFGVKAPDALPATAGPYQALMHRMATAEYEKRVNALAIKLNKRMKAMKVTREELKAPEVNFTPEQVNNIHYKDVDLNGPNATIQRGTLLFDNGKSKPYVTTAPALLRLMYRVKDGSNESTVKDFGGNAAAAHDALKMAISSMLANHGFTRVGYVRHADTKPVWMRGADRLPAEFVMGRGKDGRPTTVRDAEAQRAISTAPKLSPDRLAKISSMLRNPDSYPEPQSPQRTRAITKAVSEYHRTGNPDSMLSFYSTVFKPLHSDERTEDEHIVPSERKPGMYEGDTSFREDNPATLGKDGTPIQRDERGFLNSNNTAMVAGNMAGFEGTVPPKVEPKVGGTKAVFEKQKDGGISIEEVIVDLRRGLPTTMANFRKAVDGNASIAEATLRHLDAISDMTTAEAINADNTLDQAGAERLIGRAKEALRRARAIVDQGGVNDVVEHSEGRSQSKVGSADTGAVRESGASTEVQIRPEGSQGDRAVAGEVRRDEGVAGRATPGDARAGVAKWILAARSAPLKQVEAQIKKMSKAQLDVLSSALSDYDFLNEIDYDIDGKGAARLVDIEDLIYDNYPSEGTKASSAKASNKTLAMDSAEVKAAKDHILKTVGPKIGLTFVKAFQDGRSGEHRLGLQDQENLIRLALNGDVVGTAYHESIHEFFDILSRKGATSIRDTLERAGKNKRLLREVSRLLDGSPEAQAQLKDPQEAVAYIYQFWKLGKLNLGNETQTLFEKVSAWLRNLLGMISEEMKADMDLAQAEKILKAFDDGWVGSDKTRDFIIAKLNAETEQHNEMVKGMGQGYAKMMRTIGHVVMPVEQVIEATGNKRMIGVLRKFHQKTGDQMGEGPGYFEAVSTKRNQYLNKLENVLHKADPKDVELAREHLSKGTEPTDPVVKSIFLAVREVLDDIYQYARESQVARWDEKTHEWVVLPKRKNYFPQVWSVETIVANMEEFKQLLLEHHQDELAAIAGEAEQQGATPEMVADNIIQRVINSHGQVETSETESNLGINPMAAAVNKRALDWLNKDAFDKFKEKDLVSIMTSYVDGMVKRAEYTKRFGWGGAMLKEEVDMAFAEELGGEKLVKAAEDLHFKRVGDYLQARQKDPNTKLTEPDRRESIQMAFAAMHAKKGKEFIDNSVRDAVGRLEKANKAVMALEGTLGRDIHDNIRTLNSWMMTYQNFRLLSTTLFASFADTVGIMINGGEIKDAWEGFVRGIREVKLRWGDDKSQDIDALRAEAWGVADAGSFMDSIGQTYGSLYMNGAARRMSDKLFKYNGMEAWNRAMRIQAAKVAERVIMKMKTEGVDKHDKAAVARFEDLFGKQFKPEDIKLDANGQLDQKDVKNVAAVNRWVNGAILRPNAAQRPHWASDPHYSMLWHMKQFTYTFQNVILEKVITQAKLGNYRPAMVMMAGYTPVIIAADAVKEMLIPGDEPPWMKAGLSGLLQHGVDKAGLLGIGQLGYDAFAKDYGASLTGPAISQLIHIPMDDPAQTALGALPFGNLARRMAQ